ncbi:MAG: hypothetical protein JWO13_1144 [Acidobacteriales bacterium]|nr:hypothetical protein [Terriglobales bacterium]
MTRNSQSDALASFNSKWVLSAAILVVTGSMALLQLRVETAAFFAMVCVAAIQFGYFPKRAYLTGNPERRFLLAARVRWILIAVGVLAALVASRGNLNPVRLLIIAGAALWLGSMNVFVIFFANQPSVPRKMLLYVYYIADFWLALSLVIVGTNWLVVAGVLCLAAVNTLLLDPDRDTRLLAIVTLSAVGLLFAGIPPQARAFSAYLAVVIVFASFGSVFLTREAMRLRPTTTPKASVSDAAVSRS